MSLTEAHSNMEEHGKHPPPPSPFASMTVYLIMEWMITGGNQKLMGEVDCARFICISCDRWTYSITKIYLPWLYSRLTVSWSCAESDRCLNRTDVNNNNMSLLTRSATSGDALEMGDRHEEQGRWPHSF